MLRRRLLIQTALLVGLGLAAPAGAHTQVRDAMPGPADTVVAPVDAVVLEFLDPVVPTPTIEVTAPDGRPVDGTVRLEGESVARLDLEPIEEPGQYRVDYTYVAVDGDEQSSAYTFTVEAAPRGLAVRPLLAGFVGAVMVGLVVTALGRRWRSRT